MIIPTQKATREQTKLHNSRLVLKTIYDEGQISRADIARFTHLTATTVSSVVVELMEQGLVEEGATVSLARGKPPTLLRLMKDAYHLICLDLANRELQGSVINLRGEIAHRISLPFDDKFGEAALNLTYDLIDRLIDQSTRPLLGIAIGAPGSIDARRGVIHRAINLGWQDLPLHDLLAARYNLPIYIANDSQMAALAEYTFNLNQSLENLIVVKVGQGISAGVVLNGQLHYGDGWGASEIGHVRVVEDGAQCVCGHFGCLETVASSRAIVSQAVAIARQNSQSTLRHLAETPEAINVDVVLEAFEAGDQTLQPIIEKTGRYLGVAVANLISALNVKHVVIGGSVARFGDALLEPIQREMRERSLPTLSADTQVELSTLGQDIVVLGAAALLLANELGLV